MRAIPRFVAPLTWREVVDAWRAPPGDALGEFAARFAAFIGAPAAVIAPSARFALAAILHALELPRGGEVILPALTFHSVPLALRKFDLQPRFVDIDPATCCLDPAKLEAAIKPKTVAVLPTHLYGRACDMEVGGAIAAKHGLTVIEDCAQSCGGWFQGRRLGSLGRGAIFSFGPTKNLAMLWAGAAVLDSPELAARAQRWLSALPTIGAATLAKRLIFAMAMRGATQQIVWDWLASPALRLLAARGVDPIERATAESPADDDQAAGLMPRSSQGRLGLLQLAKLDDANARRIRNGDRLRERLSGARGVEIPAPSRPGENIYMSFPVRVPDRAAFRRRLLALGVDTTEGYMCVGPELPGFAGTGEAPLAAQVVRQLVHLPVYPELNDADIDRIADCVIRAALG